jgi:hypothetical protein
MSLYKVHYTHAPIFNSKKCSGYICKQNDKAIALTDMYGSIFMDICVCVHTGLSMRPTFYRQMHSKKYLKELT